MTRAYQLAAVATLAAVLAAAATGPGNLPTSGTVVRVYDGDTLTIEAGGKKYNVRLAGIDTPERSYTRALNAMERMAEFAPLARREELAAAMKPFRARAGALQGHAKAARKVLAALVEGRVVQLTYDGQEPARDRYKRLVAFVSIDGVDINAEMIGNGPAIAEMRYPNDRADEYVRAMRKAQAGTVGVWE